jgi:hypothetical protein
MLIVILSRLYPFYLFLDLQKLKISKIMKINAPPNINVVTKKQASNGFNVRPFFVFLSV